MHFLTPREMMLGTRVPFSYAHCLSCDTVQSFELENDSYNNYPDNYYSFRENKGSLWGWFRFYVYVASVKGVFNKLILFNNIVAKIFDEKSAYALRGIIENSSSVLDIGCGNGDLIYSFSKIFVNKNFVGIDPFIDSSKYLSGNCSILK